MTQHLHFLGTLACMCSDTAVPGFLSVTMRKSWPEVPFSCQQELILFTMICSSCWHQPGVSKWATSPALVLQLLLHLKAWGAWAKVSVHWLLQRGCKEFDVKQGTKTSAVKTSRKAEHFWVFYFQFQQKFSIPCWTFLPLTERKLLRYQLFSSWVWTLMNAGEKILIKITFSPKSACLTALQGPISSFIQH